MREKRTRSRKVPLDPELAALLERQEQRFIEKFGRPPGPTDPVFFDPHADNPQPMIEEAVDQHLLEAMHTAGIHPALIYAYQKTGRVVTQANQKFLSAADRQVWQDAIDEWYATHEADQR